MVKTQNVAQFVAVSDLSKPANEQEGILVEVKGAGGDTDKNKAKALEIVRQMWEQEEIEADLFPDGITLEHIFYVPAITPADRARKANKKNQSVSPIVEGAQEIIQLTKLQLEAQEASEQAQPYIPIIQAILDRTRPLTAEEKELAKDKKYGKTIEKLGGVIATQEEFQANCSGNGVLILNAIAWQLNHGLNKADSEE
ncbi:MAG: hypothetical protein QNJ41_14050 [Xenococcaceae cyanobacterium MO_188.B32]|nr:hypothetical protein [Xenococcaceae cyanobacterium MO_188.B32]